MATSLTPSRPWRDIAEELAKEADPKRVSELAEELNQALTEQEQKHAAPRAIIRPHQTNISRGEGVVVGAV